MREASRKEAGGNARQAGITARSRSKASSASNKASLYHAFPDTVGCRGVVHRPGAYGRSSSVGLQLAGSHNVGKVPLTGPGSIVPAKSGDDGFQIALAAIFTINASSAVLNTNETMPCMVAVRRMTLSVMPTSDTCAVVPITNEK